MTTKDLSLLLTVLADEEAAIKRTYYGRLKSIAARYDSDDLWSDVQLRALRNWSSCTSTDMDGVRKWVRVIAKNTTITALDIHIGRAKRSVKREVIGSPADWFNECSELHQFATHDDDGQVDLEELLQLCDEAVNKLPARQTKAIQRRYLDDVDYGIIAAEMAISVGAVRSLVSKGMANCREQISESRDYPIEGIGNDKTRDWKKNQGPEAMADIHG